MKTEITTRDYLIEHELLRYFNVWKVGEFAVNVAVMTLKVSETMIDRFAYDKRTLLEIRDDVLRAVRCFPREFEIITDSVHGEVTDYIRRTYDYKTEYVKLGFAANRELTPED